MLSEANCSEIYMETARPHAACAASDATRAARLQSRTFTTTNTAEMYAAKSPFDYNWRTFIHQLE